MLAQARERLGREVALSRVTLPDLAVEGVFDAAVCTFDGLNYLAPDELRLTMASVALRLRPAGWLVFDLHTDAMMNFTISNPDVAGTSAGNDFVISSVVDPGTRTCDTTIELTRPRDGDPFSEQHRQYFHTDADVRAALHDAGFAVTAVGEEYTHQPRRRLDPARDLDCTLSKSPIRQPRNEAARERHQRGVARDDHRRAAGDQRLRRNVATSRPAAGAPEPGLR